MTKILFGIVLLFSVITVSAQDFSNKGRDFWLCFPSHVPSGSSLAQQYVYITSDQNSSGVVTYNGQTAVWTVTANTVTTVPINRAFAYISPAESGTPVNKGIRVKVNDGQPAVVVYTEIFASARTEASLILPVNVLGRKYRAISYYQNGTATGPDPMRSQFQIIAVEPNTTVQIQLWRNGAVSGAPFTVTLPNMGDVYQYQDAANPSLDLSGTYIESVATPSEPCKRIAVFSGSSALAVNTLSCTGSSYDPLMQQCYPITTWGKNFGVVPIGGNPNGFHCRVMASEDNTQIQYGATNVVLNAGQVYPNIAANVAVQTQPFFISADKPVCVAQYLVSEQGGCLGPGNIGDPEMIILNPIEQNIKNITIFTSTHQAIVSQRMNVLIPTAAAGSFKINGVTIGGFQPMPTNPLFSYLIHTFPNGDNSYTLTADSGFNAICYGLGDFETYGYSAGTNVVDLYTYLQIQNPYAQVSVPAGCQGVPTYLKIVLPYQPTQITWNLTSIGFGVSTVGPAPAPIYDSTWVINGKTLYRYSAPGNPYVITGSGVFPITVTPVSTNADNCNGAQDLFFDLQIYPPPTANFTFNSSGCLSDSVHFFGTVTNTGGRPVVSYYWNFGDATTSTIQNPGHLFPLPFSYPVKFTAMTDIGCVADTVTQIVAISNPPVASFTVTGQKCTGQTVTFIDQSTSTGPIAKWYWNFGDGSPQIIATNANPQTHIYSSPGTYNATLQVETNGGCKSLLFTLPVVIGASPTANFNFTGACLPSGFTTFTDQSTISGGTISSWAWSFGDGGTSTLQNPTHNYSTTGPFTVVLSVSTANGCTDDSTKIMNTVFAQPTANFNVNPLGACLGTAFNFTDNSSAPNSTVTKWYWNFGDGSPLDSTQNPSHNFAAAGTYQVKHWIISAAGCLSDTMTKTINVYALPTSNFTIAAPNCLNQPITFTDASVPNSGSITGWNWSFGDGGTSTIQNPTHNYTNTGTFNVTLTVTTNFGCTSTVITKPVTVSGSPIANFGLPESCLLDPNSQFSDSSSGAIASWSWNFGDPNANAGNPNTSTSQNPLHKYTATGPYNVSLTVTNNAGCTATVTKQFFVNGAIPIPAFNVQGPTTFCSGGSISLTDNSTVNPGSVVKLEIYWDYFGDPTIKTVDDFPAPGKNYSHTYPSFTTPATKNITIRYMAYSGQTCVQYVDRVVSIDAMPQIQFNPVAGICQDVPAFQITQASITNGLTGTGTFSGPGVSSSGLFDPAIAGPGNHTIRYTFTSTNGCTDYKEQTINVYALPVVDAGPDRFMLQNGSIVLAATASGNGLNFLWTPNQYINNVNILRPTVNPPADQGYSLRVTTSNGCVATDSVFVKILKGLVIPNVFSPNGDGIHDRWEIPYLSSYPGCTVDIFNRYGQLIYQSKGYGTPWDGTVNGKPVPVGTYYYIIDPKNGSERRSGYVDVIR